MRSKQDRKIVYTTEYGRMCPECGRPKEQCLCGRKEQTGNHSGPVRIRYETKGRKGKGVTIIEGISEETSALIELLRILRRKCGSGGTLKHGSIEIQGDHRPVIHTVLHDRGYID